MSIQICKEVAGLMLSLPDIRKAFFHLIQPIAHDESFDITSKLAQETNLDARLISEQDTLDFFKRIVGKLHGVSLTKVFTPSGKETSIYCEGHYDWQSSSE